MITPRLMLRLFVIAVFGGASFLVACGKPEANGGELLGPRSEKPAALKLTSPVIKEGEPIPQKYTGEGDDVSPPLAWAGVPETAQAFAIICDDPDAPMGDWVHWVAYNLPGKARELAESVPKVGKLPDGSRQGKNDFAKLGYNGPMPPAGKTHRYVFTIYALDKPLGLKEGAVKADVVKAMQGHVVAVGTLMGTYRRS